MNPILFDTVRSIKVSSNLTWERTAYLTIDMDWAHDLVLADTIDLVESAGVPATWFVTHDTPLIKRIKEIKHFELGIHPNFNYLLQNDQRNGRTAQEVVEKLLDIVPNATSVRSHSMTQSSQLLDLFKNLGLTHDCNHFIPVEAGIELKPWTLWNEMIRVPYFWEDDLACVYEQQGFHPYDMKKLLLRPGLKVFDFHPIHVYLNTERLDRYENTRLLHDRPFELIKHRFSGEGSRTKLQRLVALARTTKE